jgi:hypothetical protein
MFLPLTIHATSRLYAITRLGSHLGLFNLLPTAKALDLPDEKQRHFRDPNHPLEADNINIRTDFKQTFGASIRNLRRSANSREHGAEVSVGQDKVRSQ